MPMTDENMTLMGMLLITFEARNDKKPYPSKGLPLSRKVLTAPVNPFRVSATVMTNMESTKGTNGHGARRKLTSISWGTQQWLTSMSKYQTTRLPTEHVAISHIFSPIYEDTDNNTVHTAK